MHTTGICPFPIESSCYYQFWLKEKSEIEKNKWILSERAGQDVGWDFAAWNWNMRHRTKWIQSLKASGIHTY